MRYVLLCTFFFTFHLAAAQEFAFEYWHEGTIVLESGDTLKGSVKYDMQTDLVQIQIDNKLETYTARKVLFVEIFDRTIKRYRRMYSLPFNTSGEYKAPVFFELLEEGKITLLCREALEYRTYSSSFYYYSNYSRLTIVYKYFLLKENGDIVQFVGKRNDWLDLMNDRRDEVQKFARDNRLDFDEKYHLKRIIAYYNSLFAS
ncbi:MAG TPA: hypothetical protein PKJ63_03995 [Cyclobacteriaceae bacterium]|nr:hypothetical protein [Cyclobacteriaceae bacterium]HRX00884.1 hypothetical protein [Cyclobacteriaceae bacterium]